MTERRAAYRVDYESELAQQVKFAGLPAPVAQHKFHPVRRWRFDLAWPANMLAIEVDGGIWSNGRHTRGSPTVQRQSGPGPASFQPQSGITR